MAENTIDLQSLDIKEQSPSYTYIGLDENNELVRTTISSNDDVDLSDYYTKEEMNEYINNTKKNTVEIEGLKSYKQDKLKSGENIKTINGQSILGEGNFTIEGGDVDLSNYYTKEEIDSTIGDINNILESI